MITVICPVYNESAFIKKVIEFCVTAQPLEKEIFFVDGESTDDTRAIIQAYSEKFPNIKLLHNPNRYVPFALNLAIKEAKSEVIVRLDAHTEYADDYFTKILEVFKKTGADIVGGPMRIAKGTAVQNAIGYATSTPFGVGNSSFHFEDFSGYTSSVYLGAWKKNIFETTGLFDENLKRNQDDEFHYRAKSHGFTIFQSPEIKSYYYPRSSFKKLFSQYYQYGLFKPFVLRKVRSAVQLRHLVPSFFVLYLLCIIPGFWMLSWFFLIPGAAYLIAAAFYAAKGSLTWQEKWLAFITYPILHISYGAGFLRGSLKKHS